MILWANEEKDTYCMKYLNDMILERVFYIKKGSVIREHCIISLVFVWSLISHVHSEVKHLGYDKIFDKLSESIVLVPYMYITKAVRKFVEACWYAKLVKELQVLNLFHCILYRRPWFHGTHCLEGENERKNKKKEYVSVIFDALLNTFYYGWRRS